MSEEKDETKLADITEEPPPEEERPLLQRIFVRRGTFSVLVIPILAIFTAFVIGGFHYRRLLTRSVSSLVECLPGTY